MAIVTVPTEQSTRGLARKLEAVWAAVDRACEDEDFRPRPGRGCSWCSYHAYCPAVGGDPALVPTHTPVEAPVAPRTPALVAS